MNFEFLGVRRLALVLVFLFAPALTLGAFAQGQQPQPQISQAPTEAEAFDSAKSLGTVEAWNAFVSNYPTGFRADLARAYIKQLSGQTTSPPVAQLPAAPEQPAVELTCDQQPTLRSRESKEAAKIRFKNDSEGTIVLQWIDFNGTLKEFGTIEPGAEKVFDTFLTHPWIAAYGEGSCRQIFLAAPGASLARIKPQAELPKRTAPRPQQVRSDPPLRCAPNYKKVGNTCVLMQNCGPNATRTPEGDCFCNPGTHMMDGRCQIPRQQPNQCGRNEVYSSSMGQCIPR
ncbi:MAG: hypothetical protein HY242_16805 [Afipia sp.]|nr:hypothetical protein [Afipia sp.]